MKRTAKILWNILLSVFVCFWVWIIIPKVILQFDDLDRISDGPFKARVIMAGFKGIDFLVSTQLPFCHTK